MNKFPVFCVVKKRYLQVLMSPLEVANFISPVTLIHSRSALMLSKDFCTAHMVHTLTSIAHRIKNPLRRTSEHITLHDLKH